MLSIKIYIVLKPITLQLWVSDSLHIQVPASSRPSLERGLSPFTAHGTQELGIEVSMAVGRKLLWMVLAVVTKAPLDLGHARPRPPACSFSLLPNPAAGKQDTLFIYFHSTWITFLFFIRTCWLPFNCSEFITGLELFMEHHELYTDVATTGQNGGTVFKEVYTRSNPKDALWKNIRHLIVFYLQVCMV